MIWLRIFPIFYIYIIQAAVMHNSIITAFIMKVWISCIIYYYYCIILWLLSKKKPGSITQRSGYCMKSSGVSLHRLVYHSRNQKISIFFSTCIRVRLYIGLTYTTTLRHTYFANRDTIFTHNWTISIFSFHSQISKLLLFFSRDTHIIIELSCFLLKTIF